MIRSDERGTSVELTHREIDGTRVAVLAVDGEVDLQTGPALRRHVLAAGGSTPVVVDLTRVDFFDSTGLRVLDESRSELDAAGGRLVLAGVAPQLLRLFEITGLDDRFAIYASVDDAAAGAAAAGVDDES